MTTLRGELDEVTICNAFQSYSPAIFYSILWARSSADIGLHWTNLNFPTKDPDQLSQGSTAVLSWCMMLNGSHTVVPEVDEF